ncbi:hypothetical protein ACOBQX_26170 [Actinokineospora sp. G85]|uniref:hypothetical protein n=1 Tax=Actinokineospora sp. G85 TaxID=3406626 RepID=UPI003C70D4EF
MYIEAPHIKEYIEAGRAVVADQSLCKRFGKYMDDPNLWDASGNHLEWSDETSLTINLARVGDDQAGVLIDTSSISSCSHVLMVYSPNQPGLFVDLHFGLIKVHNFYWKAPGPRFMCGVRYEGGRYKPDFEQTVEFDGVDSIFLRR